VIEIPGLGKLRRVAVGTLVWDMDGTLLDSSVAVPAAFAATLARLGAPVPDAARVIAAYSRGTPEAILTYLAGRRLSRTELDQYYRELAGVTVAPYPGVAEVLGALRDRRRPIAVLTGASRRAAGLLLASAGLDVDVLVGGDGVRRQQPAGDGLLLPGSARGRLTLPASAMRPRTCARRRLRGVTPRLPRGAICSMRPSPPAAC
jgi:phosphoglycolate phosphatase